MFRKKNGQEFMDETNLDSSTNDKEEKKGFFHRKKKKEINLYEDDMGYIEDDSNFDEDEYDKELEELQEEEKPEKKRGFFHRKKKEEEKSGGTEKLEGTKEEEESLFSDEDAIILQEPEKKKFSKKKLALICGTAAVIVIAVVFFVIRNIGGTSEGKAYVESVREITGLGTAGGANNRYTGTVDAEKSWKITLQSDLSVEKRYVNVGDQVKKGDKLFKYNTQELKLSKEKKELEQETLQNEITQLTKDIKSYQSDLKSASASEKIQLQTQILTAQTTIKKDQYTIKSNKESIKLLEKNIKDATVKSKMNGLVKKVNASLETSSSDDSSDDGSDSGDGSSDDSSYMTILAVGNYRIKGTVSETNVWSLNEGDPVIVRSRVDNSQTWKGTISSIKTDTTADDTSDSSSDYSDGYTDDESSTGETASKYNFYVKLDNDKDLMMGQHVLIEQDNGQDEQKEGMWLPSAYIKKNNNKYYVWLDSHNKLKLHEIQVGEYDENLDEYEVKSGLKTSDYIACDDSTLKEGMKVTKVSPEDNTSGYGDEQENDDAESFGSDASEDTSDVGEDYSDYSDSADTYDSSDDESLSDGADFGSDSSDSGNSGTSDSDIADFGE